LSEVSGSNWIDFILDNFSISAFQTKFVPFTVNPKISLPEETGLMYNFTITVSGINFETKSVLLDVFIIQDQFAISNETPREELNRLLSEALAILASLNTTSNQSLIISEEGNIPKEIFMVNFTRDEIDELRRNVALLSTDNHNLNLKVDDAVLKLQTMLNYIDSLNTTAVQSSETADESKELQTNNRVMIWFVISFLVFIASLIFIYFLLSKHIRKKQTFSIASGIKEG